MKVGNRILIAVRFMTFSVIMFRSGVVFNQVLLINGTYVVENLQLSDSLLKSVLSSVNGRVPDKLKQ